MISIRMLILESVLSTWLCLVQVNMIKDDGTVIHFNNPKVQASLSANTFAVTGHAETKQLTDMLPGILSQLGSDSLTSLRKLAEQFPRQGEGLPVSRGCLGPGLPIHDLTQIHLP